MIPFCLCCVLSACCVLFESLKWRTFLGREWNGGKVRLDFCFDEFQQASRAIWRLEYEKNRQRKWSVEESYEISENIQGKMEMNADIQARK